MILNQEYKLTVFYNKALVDFITEQFNYLCHVVVVSFGIMQTIDYPLKALCQLMVRLDEGGHVIGCCKYLHIIIFCLC